MKFSLHPNVSQCKFHLSRINIGLFKTVFPWQKKRKKKPAIPLSAGNFSDDQKEDYSIAREQSEDLPFFDRRKIPSTSSFFLIQIRLDKGERISFIHWEFSFAHCSIAEISLRDDDLIHSKDHSLLVENLHSVDERSRGIDWSSIGYDKFECESVRNFSIDHLLIRELCFDAFHSFNQIRDGQIDGDGIFILCWERFCWKIRFTLFDNHLNIMKKFAHQFIGSIDQG